MAKKIITISIDEDLWKEAKKVAKRVNRSLSNFISNLILLAIEGKKNKK